MNAICHAGGSVPVSPDPTWMNWDVISPRELMAGHMPGLIELWREGWETPKTMEYRHIPPWFNVANLWWRFPI